MVRVKKTWLVLTWVGATALVSFITLQGLSAAQGGVNDSPLTPVVVAATPDDAAGPSSTVIAVDVAGGASSTADSVDQSSDSGTVKSADEQANGTALVTATTSTTARAGQSNGTTASTSSPSSTTSTTVSQTTSTTATAPTTWVTTTISSPGGSVTVSYREGEVRYEAGTPGAGYDMEIDKTSPEVRVEFHGEDLPDYEIRARWTSSGFDSEINEK